MTMATIADPAAAAATCVLDALSATERRLAHDALLAQVEDNHAGGVFGWTAADHAAATDLFTRLEDHREHLCAGGENERALGATVVLLALIYPVHDLDHPHMSDQEATLAEHMLAVLAAEYGR